VEEFYGGPSRGGDERDSRLTLSEGQETHPGLFRWKSFTVAPPEEDVRDIGILGFTIKFANGVKYNLMNEYARVVEVISLLSAHFRVSVFLHLGS
jgi:hypothetical protein